MTLAKNMPRLMLHKKIRYFQEEIGHALSSQQVLAQLGRTQLEELYRDVYFIYHAQIAAKLGDNNG